MDVCVAILKAPFYYLNIDIHTSMTCKTKYHTRVIMFSYRCYAIYKNAKTKNI